jgi:hypothetical protein
LFAAGKVGAAPGFANKVATNTIPAVRYGPQPRQLLDLYLPHHTDRTRRLPTIV